jgi:hypothetical protein
MKFSLLPLLLGGESLSAEAKQALCEDRIKDAADLLMVEDGLNCAEAGHLLDLLDIEACEED